MELRVPFSVEGEGGEFEQPRVTRSVSMEEQLAQARCREGGGGREVGGETIVGRRRGKAVGRERGG